MAGKIKGLSLFNKLSRRSLNDLSEWNKNDDKLIQCVETSNLKGIQNLVKKKKVCSTKLDPQGHSALHVAAMRNKFDVMQMLIAYGADVTTVDFQGRTALHCAARHGASEVIEVLSHSKEDDWPRDDCKMTAMHHACIGGNIDCVISLIRKHPKDIEARDEDGRTSLFYAAQIGHYQVCKELLDRGTDINAQDNSGRTPLMYAAENGNHQVCELFVKKGANIDVRDKQGRAAVWHAMDAGHTVLKTIIEPAEPGEITENIQSDNFLSNTIRAVSPILEETESVIEGDNVSLTVSEDCENEMKNISDDPLDDNNNNNSQDEEDTLSDTCEEDDDDSISHLSELSYTMTHRREVANSQTVNTDEITPGLIPEKSMTETSSSKQADILFIEDGISLSSDFDFVNEKDTPTLTTEPETCQTNLQKVLQREQQSMEENYASMRQQYEEMKSKLEDYTALKQRLTVLEEERSAENSAREVAALQYMDMVLQLSELKSQLYDQENKNSMLESQIRNLESIISNTKKEDNLALDSWSDDDESEAPSDNKIETTDHKPIAKVSGQPRKMSWRDENQEIAKLKQDIEYLENEKTSLTQTIANLQMKHEESEFKYDEMSSNLKSLYDRKSKEFETLNTETFELRKHSARQQESLTSLTGKQHAYKKEIDRLRRKIELYEREYKKVREKLKRRDASEKKMLKDRHAMMKKLDEMRRKLKDVESQAKTIDPELVEENEELLFRCDEFAAKIVNLRDELDDKIYEIEKLETLAQYNEEMTNLKQREMKSMERQIHLLRDGTLALQPRKSSLGSDQADTIKSLQLQIARLQTQLADTASNHQNTLEVYRNHLILATQGLLDPDIRQALEQIIELRQM